MLGIGITNANVRDTFNVPYGYAVDNMTPEASPLLKQVTAFSYVHLLILIVLFFETHTHTHSLSLSLTLAPHTRSSPSLIFFIHPNTNIIIHRLY
jgi:hypothetical protein